MTERNREGMSTLEYHVLLATATAPLYGYAIKEAVEAESAGALADEARRLKDAAALAEERLGVARGRS